MTGKCPECGSTRIEQYRMPYGPMWCLECGFRVEDKTAQPNPFLQGTDEGDEGPAPPPKPLGEALYEWAKDQGKIHPADPPEST